MKKTRVRCLKCKNCLLSSNRLTPARLNISCFSSNAPWFWPIAGWDCGWVVCHARKFLWWIQRGAMGGGGVMAGPLKRGRPPESCVWAAGGHMTPGLCWRAMAAQGSHERAWDEELKALFNKTLLSLKSTHASAALVIDSLTFWICMDSPKVAYLTSMAAWQNDSQCYISHNK